MNLATFILSSVSLLIQLYADKDRADDLAATLAQLEPDLGVPRIHTYDFIVVGAGTAGSLVAGRLSEQFSVLLLEAGGSPPPSSEVQSQRSAVASSPYINDHFETVPQEAAAGRVWRYSCGRMLGGSGSHNTMIHNRGSPYDYDNWAALVGDGSWSYLNVLPYFTKGEDFIGALYNDTGAEGWYGYGGEYTVDTEVAPFFTQAWFDAGRELGYGVGDPNGYQQEGFTTTAKSIRTGRRVSTYKSYVKPYEQGSRPNLTVLKYSDAQEILIDGQGRATGVAYLRHGFAQRAYARKEIVISAGVVRSPLLLMKSGVGPEDVLAAAGIPVKVSRPGVGRHVSDHLTTVVGPFHVNDTSFLPRIHDGDEHVLEEYHADGSGLLGSLATAPVQGFFVSSRARAEGQGHWPDIRIFPDLAPGPGGFIPAADGRDFFNIAAMGGRLQSVGTITLNATAWRAGVRDDRELAVIDPGFFSVESDLDVIAEGALLALKITEETAVFRRLNTTFEGRPIPECLEFEFKSLEYWRCHAKHTAYVPTHLNGGCVMGREGDPMAVVDPQLRVIGVQGLRVIDGSVMPAQPNANTNAPIIMIAEKGADEIIKIYS